MAHARTATIAFLTAVVLALPAGAHAQDVTWLREFDTPFADDARGVASDGTGVYTVGFTGGALPGQSSAGGFDAFVRKYDANGGELWTRQFGSGGDDEALGVSVDATGVYVVGSTSGALPGQSSGGSLDAVVAKYDLSGNALWTRQFGTSGDDRALGVAVGPTGVHVVGFTEGTLPGQTSAGSYDAFLRMYDSAGSEVWTRQHGGPSFDAGRGVAVDSTGIYVVGEIGTTVPVGSSDAYARKFDAAGDELWSHQFGSVAADVAFDVDAVGGAVYVAGDTQGTLPGQTSAGDTDAFVRRYSEAGAEAWTRQFGTTGWESGRGVAVGGPVVYVSGPTSGVFPGATSAGFNDVFVAAHGQAGSNLGTTQLGSASSDLGASVASDATGVYVSGAFDGLTDAFVAKLTKAAAPVDRTPPEIATPGELSVDATTPAGAAVTYEASAEDDVDGPVPVACSPASGHRFAIGDTTVSCAASDSAGNRAERSFVVHVKGAAEQVADLIALVDGYQLEKLGTSLRDKLLTVQQLLASGRNRQAEESLRALVAQVEAQRGKGLSDEQATALVDVAWRIIDVIES